MAPTLRILPRPHPTQTQGREGHQIFQFRLERRAGQGPVFSARVSWGGVSAPRALPPLARPGLLDADLSGGLEALAITAVNGTDDGALPPCTPAARIPAEAALIGVARGVTDAQLAAAPPPSVEYINKYVYRAGTAEPPPAVLPPGFGGPDVEEEHPHVYLAKLNGGRLPYLSARNGKIVQLRAAAPVVFECGPWAGCPAGAACTQAGSQLPRRARLELFRTAERGWGVRSLDMIPQFGHVADYYGEVFPAAAFEAAVGAGRSEEYAMDMAPRAGLAVGGEEGEEDAEAEAAARAAAEAAAPAPTHVICGLKQRNVSASLNHSCAPNCSVQPVLSHHHDAAQPRVAIFASEDVPPMTELCFDYGRAYVAAHFAGGCRCGTLGCVSAAGAAV